MLKPTAILSISLSASLSALALAAGAAPAPTTPCGLYEAIEPDDTIASIAARCGIEEELLLLANPDIGSDLDLRIGESLMIGPTGTAAAEKSQQDQTQSAAASSSDQVPAVDGATVPADVVPKVAALPMQGDAQARPAEPSTTESTTVRPPLPQINPDAAASSQVATATRTTTVTTTPAPESEAELAPGQGDVIISAPSGSTLQAPVAPAAPATAEPAQPPQPSAAVQAEVTPSATAPDSVEPPVAPEVYSRDVVGLWQEVGGSCGDIETSWAFTPTEMRNNGLICEIAGIGTEGATVRLDVRCGGEAQTRSYLVAPFAGAGMTVTGSQFQTNLKACPS